ncbi:MAG TPA: hypothetical protein VKG84_14270 [Candidatus Acidoferrales bacterium]|nr:hypothetical protein [Candidatus Acidoferrales bacterium]
MYLEILTPVHVVISLIAILAGFVVIFGMIGGNPLEGWTKVFLDMTVTTSVTGFFFPIHGVTPGIVIGLISLVVLAFALVARYSQGMAGGWRKTYVFTAIFAQYLNFFVLVVQSFEKVPALRALAPTQKEPPFAITQLVVLVVFIALAILSAIKFRGQTRPA